MIADVLQPMRARACVLRVCSVCQSAMWIVSCGHVPREPCGVGFDAQLFDLVTVLRFKTHEFGWPLSSADSLTSPPGVLRVGETVRAAHALVSEIL